MFALSGGPLRTSRESLV